MWSVWDKKSDINGISAERHFERHKSHRNEATIFIKTVNGVVTRVEGKSILASVYGIDPALTNDEFIAEYERIINTPAEEPLEE